MTDVSKIKSLIYTELYEASKVHPMFSSDHEAYAVLLEEVEEAQAELDRIKSDMSSLWQAVKNDRYSDTMEIVKDIEKKAISAIQETIQVAAMARKTVLSQEVRNEK